MDKKLFLTLFFFLAWINVFSTQSLISGTLYNQKRNIKEKTFISDYINSQYSISTGKNLPTDRLNDLIEAIFLSSEIFEISPVLITAIIDTETTFRNLIGSLGEVGYMQIRPSTAVYIVNIFETTFYSLGYGKLSEDKVYVKLFNDAKFNILVGSAYLKHLLNNHNYNLFSAIGWYNGGGNELYAKRVLTNVSKLSILYPYL